METDRLNKIRERALDRIESSRKTAIRFLVVAAMYEGLLLVGVLFVMEFDNNTHLLIFLAACLVYGTLGFGLFSLKAYIDLSTQRILKAVEVGSSED